MRDFDRSSLWRVSVFERLQRDGGDSGFAKPDGVTVLSTTLVSELRRRDNDAARGDVLETLAACQRHREAALLYLSHQGLVWPITVFPQAGVYHAPRELQAEGDRGLTGLRLLSVDPPGLRPPGHWTRDRIGREEHYRPLMPLLWRIALQGPRERLLAELAGTAAFRALADTRASRLEAPGALGSAVERLRRETVSLRDMAKWPGLSVERAARLLNALYLVHGLMVMRSHPAARPDPDSEAPPRFFRR